MFYWVALLIAVVTMTGIGLHKKDDYRDAVMMPKVEPTVARAITQHKAAVAYHHAEGYKKDGAGNFLGTLPKEELGKVLEPFAPRGFNFRDSAEYSFDPKYDPITRFVCTDLESGQEADCDANEVFNENVASYVLTYMPIPPTWDTPYYHNMIINTIRRLSDNSYNYGFARAVTRPGGSDETSSGSYDNLANRKIYGVPARSQRAIYTMVEDFVGTTVNRRPGDDSIADVEKTLKGVYVYLPGYFSCLAKTDFPPEDASRKDIEGLLVFVNTMTEFSSKGVDRETIGSAEGCQGSDVDFDLEIWE